MSEQYRIVPGCPRALAGTAIASAVCECGVLELELEAHPAASKPATATAPHLNRTKGKRDSPARIATCLSADSTGPMLCQILLAYARVGSPRCQDQGRWQLDRRLTTWPERRASR